MQHDALYEFERTSLDRLKLAADAILSEADAIPAPSRPSSPCSESA